MQHIVADSYDITLMNMNIPYTVYVIRTLLVCTGINSKHLYPTVIDFCIKHDDMRLVAKDMRKA